MNDFIPLAVMGIGSVEMSFTCNSNGDIVGKLSLLNNNKHMHFT